MICARLMMLRLWPHAADALALTSVRRVDAVEMSSRSASRLIVLGLASVTMLNATRRLSAAEAARL